MGKLAKRFLLIAGYPGSLLNFRGPLIQALMENGLEVHVAAPNLPSGSDGLRQQLEALGVHVHEISLSRTGMNPFVDLMTTYHIWRLMRRIKPNYSLGYTIKPVIFGNIAAWLAGVQNRYSLITGLGYTFQGDGAKRSLLKRVVVSLYRSGLSVAHKVFFQNPDDEALFNSLGILNSKENKSVVVNGSGVDVRQFTKAPFPKVTQFLLIARLLGDKGVREYVQAAIRVREKHPEVRFALVGWLDHNPDAIGKDELQHWIDAKYVQFYGRLNDVRPVMAESSVYVLPSYREGTPRTVLEAMAMGRPIITTDAPGCRETVVNGENGFLVPVKSVEELVNAMLKFVKLPELICAMGRRSREIAEAKYDVIKVNEVMLKEMGVK